MKSEPTYPAHCPSRAALWATLAIPVARPLVLLAAALLCILPAGAAEDYRLGAGDTVHLSVFEFPDMTVDARVSEGGVLHLPVVGDVAASGQTLEWLQTRVADLLKTGKFVLKPQVTAVVQQYRSQLVSVVGEVNHAGEFPLDRPTRLSDLLALAGGISATGADAVTITRHEADTEKRIVIDQVSAFQTGATDQNILVQAGDVIFVPRAPLFYVYGEVVHPGGFRVAPSLTVEKALALSGGVTSRGNEQALKLTRHGPSGKVETLKAGLQQPVMADDVLYAEVSQFYIYGEVQHPGGYKVETDMTALQALAIGGGITPRGTERGMKVTRRDTKGQSVVMDLPAGDPVQAGDVIYVRERLF